jgi:VCBS repeat-containing protein
VTDEDSAALIDAAALASDPDGDALTFASLGTSASAGVATIVGGGARVRFDPSGRFNRLAAGQAAEDSFSYAVDDGHGGTAGAKVTMTVTGVDDPPSAIGDKASLEEGAAATTIPVQANDTDPDGGANSITSTTQPAHGVVTIANGGLDLTYQPDPGYCNDGEAADSFTYTLSGGSSATVALTVNCVTEVAISQGLSPKFDPSVSDYTVRCDGSPLDVSGRTAAGAEVAIDGQPPQAGSFQTAVPLEANQEFSFTVSNDAAPSDYHVRCLPSDFPAWEYEGLLKPDHQFYVVDPAVGAGGSGYAIIFDNHGVPVWWQGSNPGPIDAKFITAPGEPTRITWWGQFGGGDGYQIRELDGTVVHTVSAVGGSTDIHELQETPNGNYLVISYQPREHIDLTAFGGVADDTVVDAVVEEIDSSGTEVWSWSTQGHIGLEETGRWWPTALKGSPYDIVHMNAVEPDGENAILISLRHTDAVYKIDKATGNVVWKLGGTWTPKSLLVKGDPEGAYPLGGQHDVRLQPDGTISIHDNNTNLPDPPRVVRYAVDEGAKTATLVEEFTDPLAPSSFCCGSARRSADGSWLLSWGGNSLVTEFNAAHERTFRLGFGGSAFSYRAVAAEGVLGEATLRAGMDSMHPRP